MVVYDFLLNPWHSIHSNKIFPTQFYLHNIAPIHVMDRLDNNYFFVLYLTPCATFVEPT